MKTVRVRIAVAVNSRGYWESSGYNDSGGSDDRSKSESALDHFVSNDAIVHFIEADIPLPDSKTIEAEVVK